MNSPDIWWTLAGLVLIIAAAFTALTPSEPAAVESIDFSTATREYEPLRVGFVSDLHLSDMEDAKTLLDSLFTEIELHDPDLLLLGGDYSLGNRETSERIAFFSRALGSRTNLPTYAVLGNHEIDKLKWAQELRRSGIEVLRNEVVVINSLDLCLRGFGDVYSGDFSFVDYPEDCAESSKITFMHDPAGALDERVEGIVLAGHTHCGQVVLPILGPLWVPSDAPREYWCGTHSDSRIFLHVSAGLGESVLPVRLGTRRSWTLLELN